MPEMEALAVFAAASRAVGYLHAQSPPLLHRDVKPENRALSNDSAWKLCDFGSVSVGEMCLATPRERAVAESDVRKNTTPAYRAPEMWAMHRWRTVGPPADDARRFALGCLLYQLCFARLPFGVESKMPALCGSFKFPRADRVSEGTRALIEELLSTEPSAETARGDDARQTSRTVAGGARGRNRDVRRRAARRIPDGDDTRCTRRFTSRRRRRRRFRFGFGIREGTDGRRRDSERRASAGSSGGGASADASLERTVRRARDGHSSRTTVTSRTRPEAEAEAEEEKEKETGIRGTGAAFGRGRGAATEAEGGGDASRSAGRTTSSLPSPSRVSGSRAGDVRR